MSSDTETRLRPCGDCTACCQGWMNSDTLDMHPGKACKHLAEAGCTIYADRPQAPCRNFNCAWVHTESGLPDDMRPDRCGAIVKWKDRWMGWEVVAALPVGRAIPEDTLKRLIDYAKARSQPIIFLEHEVEDGQYVRSQHLATGPSDFLAEIKNGITADDIFHL